MRIRIGIAVILALVTLTACASPTKNETLTAKPAGSVLPGRFFATAGPGETQADLFNVVFAPGLLMYALTDTHRTFGVDGCSTSLTVDVAGPDVDFQDALRRFDSGKISPIDGLGDGKGALATVAPDCRLVFMRIDRNTSPPSDHLMLFDPMTRMLRELYSPAAGKVLGISDWSRDGRVAVFEGTEPSENHPTVPTGIVIISADGRKRTVPSPVSSLGTLKWGSKWMAIGDEANRKTVFLDPDSAVRAELPGWTPLTWSPDGQQLIVTDALQRKALGLVDAGKIPNVQPLGHASKVQFLDFLWLPSDATAGGSLPVGRRPDDGNGETATGSGR